MRYGLLLIGMLLLLNRCQYPISSAAFPDLDKFLVIDAQLTESYGKINVYYTLTDVTEQGGYLIPPPISNGSAYVLDSHGNRTDFPIDGSTNTNFHGVVGETYRLYVSAEGESYESNPETMLACPTLDSLSLIFTSEETRALKDLSYYGFDVYANTNDIPGQENYYQWDWIHYERAVGCKTIEESEQPVLVPCDPNDCWNIGYNTRTIVQSDKLRDGQALAHKIVRVPFTTPPVKYYLKVEQRSITASVFAYLQSIETQTQNVGSVFDVPAQTKFNPNVYNVNKRQELILGVFSVFSFKTAIVYVDRGQKINGMYARSAYFNPPFTSQPLLSEPCVEGIYRTQKRPEDWHD